MTDPKSMYTPMRGFVPGEMLCPIHEWCPQRIACAVANECKTALDRAAAQDATPANAVRETAEPVIQNSEDELLIDGEAWIRRARYDQRVTELLAANNAEVERRRKAEGQIPPHGKLMGWKPDAPPPPAPDVVFDVDFASGPSKTIHHGADALAYAMQAAPTALDAAPRGSVAEFLDEHKEQRYSALIAYAKSEFPGLAQAIEAALHERESLRVERDALLSEWNAMVLAIGAPKHGTAIAHAAALKARDDAAEKRVRELEATLNTPELHDFAKAVVLEAAHQRQRWPSEHDAGKTDADWFWLIGYLSGKALHNPPNDMPPVDAKLHRIVTVAAAAANWHAAISGASNVMRPGIEPPSALAGGNDGR